VDRAGLRRKLLKAQAEAGDIVLLFGDESEALTHPYLAHAWAKRGADLRVPAPGRAAKVAMLGVLDRARRDLLVRTSRTKRGSDFIALLAEIDQRWGPTPGEVIRPVVLVLDNGPTHTGKATRAALAGRTHWARRRVAAETRPGAERHRGRLARPEAAPPRPPDIHRPGGPRPCHPRRGRRAQCGAQPPSVGQPANRCLGRAVLSEPAVANRALEAGAFARFEDPATLKARVERETASSTALVQAVDIKSPVKYADFKRVRVAPSGVARCSALPGSS
jgi:hypothetical protein